MRSSRPLLIAVGALVTLLVHRACPAQTMRDPIAAEALFEAGKRMLKADDWKGACTKFEKSWELDPAVGTMIKIAKCHEHDGKLATAWYDYQRAEGLNREKVEQSPARRRELEDFIRVEVKKLEARLPRLTISAREPPAGLRLYRDGQMLSPAVLGEALPLDPGNHEIMAEAPGHVSERHAVNLLEGDAKVVTLTLARAEAKQPSSERPPASRPAVAAEPRHAVAPPAVRDPGARGTTAGGSSQRTFGLLLGGAGVVGLGVGAYFGLRTMSLVRESDPYCQHPGGTCDDAGIRLRERAGRAQTTGIIAAGAGGAALIAGAFVVVTASGHEAAVALSLAPTSLTGTVLW